MKHYRISVNGQSYDVEVEEVGGGSAPAAPPTARANSAATGAPSTAQAPAKGASASASTSGGVAASSGVAA